MKVSIGPAGVKALLEAEPQATLELAKNASQQVADAMMNKFRREEIDRFFKKFLENDFRNYYQQTLAVKYHADIASVLKNHAQSIIDQSISTLLSTQLNRMWEEMKPKIEKDLEGMVDDLLHKRFVAIFNNLAKKED